ncbi:MAG TPA: hypothetical protein VF988_11815 [Verrucomicrobiae bacterium]
MSSNAYFMPVLGIIFLRHAANRFATATAQIEADQAAGRMPKRKILPADYIRRRALWLPETARYDYIMEQVASTNTSWRSFRFRRLTITESSSPRHRWCKPS